MLAEPELFVTHRAIVADSREVVHAHVEALSAQVAAIVADGVGAASLSCQSGGDRKAIFYATARFVIPHTPRDGAIRVSTGRSRMCGR